MHRAKVFQNNISSRHEKKLHNLIRRSALSEHRQPNFYDDPNYQTTNTLRRMNAKHAIDNLRKDKLRIVMKADKGNCFVVIDRSDYEDIKNTNDE
jgi:hypothetical protein